MANPVDVHVGLRLKERRKLLGLSQNKLGELVGVTFQQIQKNEKGINRIASSRLYQFSQILLVPVGYFFEGYDDEVVYNTDYRKEDVDNKQITKLVKSFIRIKNVKVRKGMLLTMKGLSENEN